MRVLPRGHTPHSEPVHHVALLVGFLKIPYLNARARQVLPWLAAIGVAVTVSEQTESRVLVARLSF
jgi:hypothetical protein